MAISGSWAKTTGIPVQPKAKKRPKFAPGTGTPKQRAILLSAAAGCMLVAFLLPSGKDENPDNKGFEEAVLQSAPTASVVVPRNHVVLPANATLGRSTRDPSFPPVSELSVFTPSTPAEYDQRIDALSKYYSHSSSKERDAAYQATLALGPELISRLPALIENAPPTALVNYAQAARDLKAANATPALIARIEAKGKMPVARFEMFSALASFDDPKARAYVAASIEKSEFITRNEIWAAVGKNMNAAQADLALKAISAGGQDCFAAAKALAQYGATFENASPLVPRMQPLLSSLKDNARLALVKAVAGMDSAVAGNLLTFVTFEQDPAVRAAALAGLAHCPNQQGMAISAFRNEQNTTVKLAMLGAFAESPCDAILPDMVILLNDPVYGRLAREVLTAANKGHDRGAHDFDWVDWLKERNAPKTTAQAEIR